MPATTPLRSIDISAAAIRAEMAACPAIASVLDVRTTSENTGTGHPTRHTIEVVYLLADGDHPLAHSEDMFAQFAAKYGLHMVASGSADPGFYVRWERS